MENPSRRDEVRMEVARRVESRIGKAGVDYRERVTVRSSRLGWKVVAMSGQERIGRHSQAFLGKSRTERAWTGKAGAVGREWPCWSLHDKNSSNMVWQACLGIVGTGFERSVLARKGAAGDDWRAESRLGQIRHGRHGHDGPGENWSGTYWTDKTRLGQAGI